MAKNQHTGGEGARWKANLEIVYDDGTGKHIAEASPKRRGIIVRDAERLANARLMAAAPEMLDALREILSDASNDLTEDARNAGLAAIATATGEEGTS